MDKEIKIFPELCIGCRLCELACSLKHEKENNPAKSRINVFVFFEDWFFLPVTCIQCVDPACAKACPEDAIVKNQKSGSWVVLKEKCTSCGPCFEACPFGMHISDSDEVAYKCNLCDGNPECVEFCPTGALKYLDFSEEEKEVRNILFEKLCKCFEIYHSQEPNRMDVFKRKALEIQSLLK